MFNYKIINIGTNNEYLNVCITYLLIFIDDLRIRSYYYMYIIIIDIFIF